MKCPLDVEYSKKDKRLCQTQHPTLQDFLTGVTYLNLRGIPLLSLSQESLWIGFHREQGKNLTHREEGKSSTQNFYMVS